jgi:hypothetical protein
MTGANSSPGIIGLGKMRSSASFVAPSHHESGLFYCPDNGRNAALRRPLAKNE